MRRPGSSDWVGDADRRERDDHQPVFFVGRRAGDRRERRLQEFVGRRQLPRGFGRAGGSGRAFRARRLDDRVKDRGRRPGGRRFGERGLAGEGARLQRRPAAEQRRGREQLRGDVGGRRRAARASPPRSRCRESWISHTLVVAGSVLLLLSCPRSSRASSPGLVSSARGGRRGVLAASGGALAAAAGFELGAGSLAAGWGAGVEAVLAWLRAQTREQKRQPVGHAARERGGRCRSDRCADRDADRRASPRPARRPSGSRARALRERPREAPRGRPRGAVGCRLALFMFWAVIVWFPIK